MVLDSFIHYFMSADTPPGMNSGPVPSPCVSLCQIDQGSQLCQGCLRTLGLKSGAVSS
jgi:hypothetical protein